PEGAAPRRRAPRKSARDPPRGRIRPERAGWGADRGGRPGAGPVAPRGGRDERPGARDPALGVREPRDPPPEEARARPGARLLREGARARPGGPARAGGAREAAAERTERTSRLTEAAGLD